jgi:NAD(P)-dependent dehydrogenase (short-subunit alcohol dehydrogenase family)
MRRILVTGAASGIGAALVALLKEEGATVLELDVAERAGGLRCDLGDAAQVDTVAGRLGGEAPLDGIAHVAGLPGTHPPARVLAVNYLGPLRLTESLVPKLAPGASVVFVSSVAAHRCLWSDDDLRALAARAWDDALADISPKVTSGSDAYDLSKRLLAFSLPALTARHAAHPARVNLVSPGPVETPILGDFRQTMGEARILAAAKLTGRHARPEEIAQAIAFLLRPTASWINGIDLRADGGLHALRAAASS